MKNSDKRVALWVVQYEGMCGWDLLRIFRTRAEACKCMRERRKQGCMNRAEEKKFRVVRYMPVAQ